MIFVFVIALIYVLGIFGFCLWDSWIGMPVEWYADTWQKRDHPPLAVAAVFWPLSTSIVALIKFSNYLNEAKERRLQQEVHKHNLRIATQKELDNAMEQMDVEMKTISADKRV